jgi:hypothetical protein
MMDATRARPRPNFIVIGAMKAGTTSLHAYLGDHPDVFVSEPKELHFFVESRNWTKGLDWYFDHFAESGSFAARGETSVTYSKCSEFPGVARRMSSVLPDVRIVYVVRDPIDRMRSHYLHDVAAGVEHLPIHEALLTRPKYVEASSYGLQLAQYLECFDRDRIHVLSSESLRDRPSDTLSALFRFLEVRPEWVPTSEYALHTTLEKTEPIPAVRRLRGSALARVAATLPRDLRTRVRRTVPRRPVQTDQATITDELRSALVERLRDDMTRLQSEFPAVAEPWRID